MVSIIIPVFNSENYLKACLSSICNQTFQNIEIIIINDGSTDGSLSICQSFAEKDIRIKLVTVENGGVSAARNYGINIAEGEYITFVDSDDYIDCEFVEKMMSAAIKTEADLIVCGHVSMKKDIYKNVFLRDCVIQGHSETAKFVADNYLLAHVATPWGKLYKKEKILSKFDETISFGEDTLFNINYFSGADSICNISECLYYYRSSVNNSLSSSYRRSDYDGIKKGYLKAYEYLNNSIEKYSMKNVAYKYFIFTMALIVKMHLSDFVSNAEKEEFAKMICYDSDFIEATGFLSDKDKKRKMLIWFIIHKKYRMLLLVAKVRAVSKKLKWTLLSKKA